MEDEDSFEEYNALNLTAQTKESNRTYSSTAVGLLTGFCELPLKKLHFILYHNQGEERCWFLCY